MKLNTLMVYFFLADNSRFRLYLCSFLPKDTGLIGAAHPIPIQIFLEKSDWFYLTTDFTEYADYHR